MIQFAASNEIQKFNKSIGGSSLSYYLAIDIGASSGRHILGSDNNGELVIEEIHRFHNGFSSVNNYLCWNLEALFEEILVGIAKCKEIGKIPASIGIDTWGVDFVLLDKDGAKIGDAVAYRDSRTDGMDDVLSEIISEQELYSRTGIQKLAFNTIYQLLALQRQQPDLLKAADGFLMIPEYFSYLLTGKRAHEYTIATTTGLVNAEQKNWDYELLERIGFDRSFFGEIVPPGTVLGGLLPKVRQRVGFDCKVILPCTHDTGSAVVSASIDDESVFLSSGTWSLMGVLLDNPICTEESRLSNLSNEGGYQYRFRYLKNIMGLWMIQCIKKEYDNRYSFDDLRILAEKNADFPSVIDVNEGRFLAPENMVREIKLACGESEQRIPSGLGELVFCVYNSLAISYAKTIAELESITGKRYSNIVIVGGGSQNRFLNDLTARVCGKNVIVGAVEATAIGNIMVQSFCHCEPKGEASHVI